MHAVIDMTMLQIDISDDTIDDPTEHDRVRARRVVEYILDRFPVVRYNDAPDEVDDEVDRNADEATTPTRPSTNSSARKSSGSATASCVEGAVGAVGTAHAPLSARAAPWAGSVSEVAHDGEHPFDVRLRGAEVRDAGPQGEAPVDGRV
jgi:hypothetical protein